MKTVIIANPRASFGRVKRRWTDFHQTIIGCFGPVQVRMTPGPGAAAGPVRACIDSGVDRIVVVGGDGTVNEAVNGFFDGDAYIGKRTSLVVYPVGTGGDFARSVGLTKDCPEHALKHGCDRLVDVGRAVFNAPDGNERVRYFINISSFGVSGTVAGEANTGSKILGGKATFAIAAVKSLIRYQNQRVRIEIDDRFDEAVKVKLVAVANGRYFGGSMKIAPDAVVDDGRFDVIIVGDLSRVKSFRFGHRLYRGTHVGLDDVRVVRGKRVSATPLEGRARIEIDGEQPGMLPVRYEILPRRLRLFAPWSRAEAIYAG